jgi:hypothetical protein
MATMTMPRHSGWVVPRTYEASNKETKAGALPSPTSSLMHGVAALGGILAVALFSVIAPMVGPPSEEASALIQAKETQALAQRWVVAHPEDAVPTGDPRAWGFVGAEEGASCADSAC